MSTTDTRAMRQEFVAYWRARYQYSPTHAFLDEFGNFCTPKDDPVHMGWEAWQAATEAAKAEPAEYKGWYCAHCQRGVDASEVTFHEQHTVCGRAITDDCPPSAKATGTAGEHSHQGNRYGNLTDAEYIEMTRQEAARQPAPVSIKTWQESVGYPANALPPNRIERAMAQEIADLRAALAARSQP